MFQLKRQSVFYPVKKQKDDAFWEKENLDKTQGYIDAQEVQIMLLFRIKP